MNSWVRPAGREPSEVAGTGHLRNDEKLYKNSGNLQKRIQSRKILEVKWAGIRMGDCVGGREGQSEEEGSKENAWVFSLRH